MSRPEHLIKEKLCRELRTRTGVAVRGIDKKKSLLKLFCNFVECFSSESERAAKQATPLPVLMQTHSGCDRKATATTLPAFYYPPPPSPPPPPPTPPPPLPPPSPGLLGLRVERSPANDKLQAHRYNEGRGENDRTGCSLCECANFQQRSLLPSN